jgi:bifunctional enzyme CysN/CysC
MDLVAYSNVVFDAIVHQFREFASRVGLTDVSAIPIVAVDGDNVVTSSGKMPWYRGPTLLQHLDTVTVDDEHVAAPFRMPVQSVIRPDADFRGFAGMISSGQIGIGAPVVILPSGRRTNVARILLGSADVQAARAGQSVTLTLVDHSDVSRGDVLASSATPPEIADQFQATLVWLAESPLLPGRSYLARIGAQTVSALAGPLKYKIDVETREHLAAKTLEMNDIGVCVLQLAQPVAFEPYQASRDLGGILLIDRMTNDTVGAGLLQFALHRSSNLRWHGLDVDKHARAAIKQQKACVVWFTGLSASGKSTIANVVERKLQDLGRHTYLLDGDNVRRGLNRDLGFSPTDRVENIRRVAEVSRLMTDAGLIVLVSFISPFRAERRAARELHLEGGFFEVFVDTPLQVAEARDPKGLYEKARAGLLQNFTGIDSPYEPPEHPEMRIETVHTTADQAADAVVDMLRRSRVIW